MKKLYKAPQSERIELMHRESLMLTGSTGSADVIDNAELEAISKGWNSSDWSGHADEAED